MDNIIYCYGNGQIIKGVFDAIASFFGDDNMVQGLINIGMMIGGLWAFLYLIYGNMMTILNQWLVPLIAVQAILFVPKQSVHIIDPVTHYHGTVDNVPVGLASFAGLVSGLGDKLTRGVEKVFALPDDLKYHKSGFMFAGELMQKAKSFQITDSIMADNMQGFVEQCIVFDAARGIKYTIQDLRHTDDIWALVSEQASPVRGFVWRNPRPAPDQAAGYRRAEIVTCREAVNRINGLWNTELNRAAETFGLKIFSGRFGTDKEMAKRELLKYLPLSYATMGRMAKSAGDILKQQMMMHSVVDGIEQRSVQLGNAPNYAARRAYLQQRSTYETLGHMAAESLPTMKAVIEAICYAFFIFVVPLVMLPMGWKFLITWGQTLLWLQMWAPLYAILNYIMTMSLSAKTMGALAASNPAGVTLASSVGIYNMHTDMAAMAGYLAMSIPFLSIALVKGVGSFVHMAAHLGGVSQSAAGAAAAEATSGNYNLGNITQGSVQMHQTSMLQQSHGASYHGHSMTTDDGQVSMTTTANGNQVGSVRTDQLPISLNVAESQSQQYQQLAGKSESLAINQSQSASTNMASSLRNMTELGHRISNSDGSSDSWQKGISTEQGQSIQKGQQYITDFAKQNNMSESKAASLMANVSTGIGLGKSGVSLFNFSAGVEGKGTLSAEEQQVYQNAEKMASSQDYQQTLREAHSAAHNIAQTAHSDEARSLATNMSGSYEQSENYRGEASKNFSKAESYQEQASSTQARSASINANHSKPFVDYVASQNAGGMVQGPMGREHAMHIIANKPEMTANYARSYMEQNAPIQTVEKGNLEQSYQDQQILNPVTKDHMRQVQNKSDVVAPTDVKDRVKAQMMASQQYVVNESGKILRSGANVEQQVEAQQGRSVVQTVANKGIDELMGSEKNSITKTL